MSLIRKTQTYDVTTHAYSYKQEAFRLCIKHIVGRSYIVKPTCMSTIFHIIQVADAVISRQ